MKKTWICFLTCFFFILVSTSFSFASTGQVSITTNENSKVIYENQEIKDLDVLFNKALKGETDLEVPVLLEGILINKKTGEKKTFKTYKTTQLLKVKKDKNGGIYKEYATTAFTVFNLNKTFDNSVSTSSEEGEYSAPAKWDSTGHVRAYSTIYFVFGETTNGVQTILTTRATGGWDVYDNQYSLQDRKVTITCNGLMEGRIGVSDQIQYEYPDWLTFEYYTDPNWDPVMTTFDYKVGDVTDCEIYRGGDHWHLQHYNMLP